MKTINKKSATVLTTAALILGLAVSAQAGSTFYSEYVGRYVTLEQEQQAIEADRITAAKKTVIHASKSSGPKFYSEYVGRYATLEQEQQAIEADRIVAAKKTVIHASESPVINDNYFSRSTIIKIPGYIYPFIVSPGYQPVF